MESKECHSCPETEAAMKSAWAELHEVLGKHGLGDLTIDELRLIPKDKAEKREAAASGGCFRCCVNYPDGRRVCSTCCIG